MYRLKWQVFSTAEKMPTHNTNIHTFRPYRQTCKHAHAVRRKHSDMHTQLHAHACKHTFIHFNQERIACAHTPCFCSIAGTPYSCMPYHSYKPWLCWEMCIILNFWLTERMKEIQPGIEGLMIPFHSVAPSTGTTGRCVNGSRYGNDVKSFLPMYRL